MAELTAEMDTAGLFAALDAVGRYADTRLREAARVTAEAVRDAQRRRIRHRTGATAETVVVREDRQREGYIVTTNDVLSQEQIAERKAQWGRRRSRATRANVKHVGLYLEYGTINMGARPFFWEAARLEENAFDRRVKDALAAAIEESGLGS